MSRTFSYTVNLPKGQIKAEPGADDKNKNELLAFLKEEDLIKQYAAKEGVDLIDSGGQTLEEVFSIDLPNGIFKAETDEQHEALMSNLRSMKDAGILQPLATKIPQPAKAVAALPAQTIVQFVTPNQQQLGVQDVLGYDKDLRKMEEIKSLYHAGLALTLSEANEIYIKFSFDDNVKNAKTIKDYRSRMNTIIEICGNRFLHELENDDVVQIENALLETPTSRPQKKVVTKKKLNEDDKPQVLNRSTISERLRHLKAVYNMMIARRRYFGENRRFKKIFNGETAEQLTAHDMRRSFNEYLKKRGVQLDIRSAVTRINTSSLNASVIAPLPLLA